MLDTAGAEAYLFPEHSGNIQAFAPMSLSPNLPVSAIEYVVALLVRLMLPNVGEDTEAARALALDMLADYHPRTVRELRLAGEIIGCGLNTLQALADCGQ